MTAPRKETLSAEDLRRLFDYEPDTGILAWKVRRYRGGKQKAGTVIKGAVKIGDVTCQAARVIWCMVRGEWPQGNTFWLNGNSKDWRLRNIGIVPPPPADGILTQEYLRQVLDYCPETGQFFYRVTAGSRGRFGMQAGSPRKQDGSWTVSVDGKTYHRNRLAWFYMTGEWPKNEIDHKNGDRSDDRFANLREATHAQNTANRGAGKNSKTGLKGVYPTADGRFQVQCNKTHVGCYRTIGEAAVARVKAEIKMHGEFAYSQRYMAESSRPTVNACEIHGAA